MPRKNRSKPAKKRKTSIAWSAARRAKKKLYKLDPKLKSDRARTEKNPKRNLRNRQLQTNKTGGAYGRPTMYHPKFCRQVIDLGKEGKSPTQIAAHFGVARVTVNQNWRKKYPDFAAAWELAMVHAQAYWEERLHERISSNSRGGGPAVTALTFMLARRFRDDYKDMKEITGAKGTPLLPMSADLPTKEKVRAYLDAVKGGNPDEEDL